jgi:hypothetical protein
MRAFAGLATVGLLIPLFSPPSWAGDVKDYLTDGKLKDKLTLVKIHHVDNAGRVQSTNTWVIEASGEWTQTTSGINFGIVAPKTQLVAKGKLTAAQLAALAQHLATQDFNKLTAQLGLDPAPAKEHYSTTLSFGNKKTVLLTAGGQLTDALPKAGDARANDWSRFVVLTLVVQNLLQEPKAEPKKAK